MSEAPQAGPGEPDDPGWVEDPGGAAATAAVVASEHTGVPEVDAVIDSLAGLEGRPVGEHAVVFEEAHDRLRSALEPEHASV